MKALIKTLRIYRPFLLILAIILGCILLTFINIQFVKGNEGGNDFLTNWMGTRSFLNNGQSPYSAEITQNIQMAVYGRDSVAGERGFEFALPLYSIMFFIPFALIKNALIAQALWMTVLEVAIIAIVLLSIQLVNWKITPLYLAALLLFSLLGFHGVLPLLDGSFVILTTLMITGTLVAIQAKYDEAAGILLALCTITPAVTFLFLLFIIIWGIFNHRIKIITWFLGSFGLLIGFSFALIPNWFLQFLKNFIASYNSIDPGSPGGVLISRWGDIGGRLSIAISVLIGILLLIEWWQVNKAGQRFFLWTAMLTLVLSTWSGIKISPVNFVLLYPALVLGLKLICERWKQRAYGIVLSILALLFIGSWTIYFITTSAELIGKISSFLFFPLPVAVIILLYWSRWWVRKSNKVEFEPALIELKKL